ncbi:MAG: hypothetical protein BV458_07305 [Thermoplasmata archaeon M9B2D]|nr:MAG: hypothetical protein BV458_07305 [Thermoplasmata archaeon M9B2D]
MNQEIPLDRVESTRNAGVFILLRTLVGMFIFVSLVNDVLYFGCGLCVSTCPAEAVADMLKNR